MCARYHYTEKCTEILLRKLGLSVPEYQNGDVTPGMSPVVIGNYNGKLSATNMHWGMKSKNGSLIINARSESALQKPMFSSAIESRRVLIPTDKFYEWDSDRNKVTFSVNDSDIIFLAGIYNITDNKMSFAILTTAANSSMSPVHDRMPLMISDSDISDWIFDFGKANALLHKGMPALKAERQYEQLSLFDA